MRTLLTDILNRFRRFKMCLKCPLDPEECGYTNKIMKNGNCIKEKKKIMKLYELLDIIDPNRDYDDERIQIVYEGSCWDVFEEALSSSTLLVPLYNAEVTSLSAILANVYRVGINVPDDIVMFPLSEKELKQCIWEGIHEGLGLDVDAIVPNVEAQKIYTSIRKRLEKEKHNEQK